LLYLAKAMAFPKVIFPTAEFWPYGLKQAGASWIELIATLKSKNMAVHQVEKHGLVYFHSESVSERWDWYVNLFASPK
jgi:hypothetical protein